MTHYVLLTQLQVAQNEEQYTQAMDMYCSWRLNVDGLGGKPEITKRREFIELASFHFGLTVIQPMADQVREGLKMYNVS